jgi:hypothetical protein
MSTKVVSKIISPEGEHEEIQQQIVAHEARVQKHDRFTEHYTFKTPAEMFDSLQWFMTDCARLERENLSLDRENRNMSNLLKTKDGLLEECHAEIKRLRGFLNMNTEWHYASPDYTQYAR